MDALGKVTLGHSRWGRRSLSQRGTARVGLGFSGCSGNFSAVVYGACGVGRRQNREEGCGT